MNVLFIYIFFAGIIGDIIIHIFAQQGIMGAALMPYYRSFGNFWPWGKKWNFAKSVFYPAISGGIACVVGLTIAYILIALTTILVKEEENEKQP
jgi:hypothetical protein